MGLHQSHFLNAVNVAVNTYHQNMFVIVPFVAQELYTVKGKIMSRYATYKLWGDRSAPHNIEFNGRLIGELAIQTEPTTRVVHYSSDNTYFCDECGYLFRYKKDAQTFNYCPICGHKIVRE
jgi:hypothetical protein